MKIEIGMNVESYEKHWNGFIAVSRTFTGEVVKVNKKSFIVKLTHVLEKHGDDVVVDTEYNVPKVKYTYWHTTESGRIIYKSDSKIYGIIEFEEITEDSETAETETKRQKRKPITSDIDMIKDFAEEKAHAKSLFNSSYGITAEREAETATETEPETATEPEILKPLEIKPKIHFICSLREKNVERFHVDFMSDNKRIGTCELYIKYNVNNIMEKAICRFLYIIDDDFKDSGVEKLFLRMLANEYNGIFCVPYDSDDCELYFQIGEECKIPSDFEWSHVVEKCFFISPDKNNERNETDIDNFNKKSAINSMYGITANTSELLALEQFERLTGTLFKSLFKAIGLEETRRIPIIISNNMVFFNYNGTQYKYNPSQCKVYKKDGKKYQRINWKDFKDDNSTADQKQSHGRSPPFTPDIRSATIQ